MVDRDDRAVLRPVTPRAPLPAGGTAVVPPELDARLGRERVAWLTTVRPDGAPHVVPVWFLWDGATFVVFSKPTARKVRNIAAEGRVMLAVGDAEADFDVQLIEGDAHLVEGPAIASLDDRLVHKYGPWMAGIALSPAEFAATYSQAIRVVPTRFLPWRGRTGGRPIASSARPDGGSRASVGRASRHPIRAAGAGMTFVRKRIRPTSAILPGAGNLILSFGTRQTEYRRPDG